MERTSNISERTSKVSERTSKVSGLTSNISGLTSKVPPRRIKIPLYMLFAKSNLKAYLNKRKYYRIKPNKCRSKQK